MVSIGNNRGFVQRPAARVGFVQRTYVVRGRPYVRAIAATIIAASRMSVTFPRTTTLRAFTFGPTIPGFVPFISDGDGDVRAVVLRRIFQRLRST